MTTEYGTVETPSMNKIIIQRFYDEFMNPCDLDHAGELVAYDYEQHGESDNSQGLEGLRSEMSSLTAGFPDLHFEVEDMVAEGDKVVARIRISGTNTGIFMGKEPTRKKINAEKIDIFRLNNGKIQEHWSPIDLRSLLKRLLLAKS